MTRSFSVTWDYRCPFARNVHEHVVSALEAGAGWEVGFLPFSLDQVHVEEGQPDVWDDPLRTADLLAMLVGLVVRDRFADNFLAVHLALFAARFDHGRDLRREEVLRDVVASCGLDPERVFAEIAAGWALDTFRKEHERCVADHAVFGVPTFVVGDQAAFVRLMHRPDADPDRARTTIERVLDLAEHWPQLNELKHTTIPR